MATIEEQIKEIITERYDSIPKFAEAVGIPAQTIYAVLRRGIGSASTSTVLPIMAKLGIDSNWIIKNRLIPIEGSDSDFVDVPLLGRIAAGEPIEMDAVENTFPIPRPVYQRFPGSFLLIVDGESMSRVLPNGCYALIDPSKKADVINGKTYAVCVNGYDATIKRVKKLSNGFELIPDSNDPTYHPVVYDYSIEGTDTITILGEVVWYTLPYDWTI